MTQPLTLLFFLSFSPYQFANVFLVVSYGMTNFLYLRLCLYVPQRYVTRPFRVAPYVLQPLPCDCCHFVLRLYFLYLRLCLYVLQRYVTRRSATLCDQTISCCA
jgi:hypothetical protein